MYTYSFKGRQKYVSMSKAILKRTNSILLNVDPNVYLSLIQMLKLTVLVQIFITVELLFHVTIFYYFNGKDILSWLLCSSSNLPSPSSTTAWITMGNTPRSRSKFSFKRKEFYYSMRRGYKHRACIRVGQKLYWCTDADFREKVCCESVSRGYLQIHDPVTKTPPTAAHTYIFLFPLAEVYFERRHGELLAHPSLVVHSFRHQWWILWAVPTRSMPKRKMVSTQEDEGKLDW